MGEERRPSQFHANATRNDPKQSHVHYEADLKGVTEYDDAPSRQEERRRMKRGYPSILLPVIASTGVEMSFHFERGTGTQRIEGRGE